jgi:hypothetical protein
MKKKVGLWIDHRKAIIVTVADEGEEITRIRSNVEKQFRPSGGSRTDTHYGPHDVMAGDQQDKQFAGHLSTYYDEVISCIRDAEFILIFGPGEPKGELKKRIESKKLHGRIVGIETVDNMTDGQIASKVRQYFLNLK